jgi:hypothetical protein
MSIGTVRDGEFLATDEQVWEIIADRHGDKVRWHRETNRRLKSQYITRPGKPARRFELLEEISKRKRGTNQDVGSPSKYRMTGIKCLLDVEAPESADPHHAVLHDEPTTTLAMAS